MRTPTTAPAHSPPSLGPRSSSQASMDLRKRRIAAGGVFSSTKFRELRLRLTDTFLHPARLLSIGSTGSRGPPGALGRFQLPHGGLGSAYPGASNKTPSTTRQPSAPANERNYLPQRRGASKGERDGGRGTESKQSVWACLISEGNTDDDFRARDTQMSPTPTTASQRIF